MVIKRIPQTTKIEIPIKLLNLQPHLNLVRWDRHFISFGFIGGKKISKKFNMLQKFFIPIFIMLPLVCTVKKLTKNNNSKSSF